MGKEKEGKEMSEALADVTPFHSAHGEFQETLRQVGRDLSQELSEAANARREICREASLTFRRTQEEALSAYQQALDEAASSEKPYAEAEQAHTTLVDALRKAASTEIEAQRGAEEDHGPAIEQIRKQAIERVRSANCAYVEAIRKAWSEIETNSFDQADLYRIGESIAQVAADTASALQACRYS